jgi:hypothetical protein
MSTSGSEIVKEDTRELISAERASQLYHEILEHKRTIGIGLCKLGRIFKLFRDEKLYELLGCESFREFIGQPEIAFAESSVRAYIAMYETWVIEYGYEEEDVANVGLGKLQVITHPSRLLPSKREEMFDMANSLSKSDLKQEIRVLLGQEEEEPEERPERPGELSDFGGRGYEDYVRDQVCCICGNPHSEPHHFPQTRKRTEDERYVIPMCRACHTAFHHDPIDFRIVYGHKIFRYFYRLAFKAIDTLERMEQNEGQPSL